MTEKQAKALWAPVSSHAYGADAVYIPHFGQPGGVEFIIALTQNYPNFKKHPVLNIWKGYTCGPERFDSNMDMRILAWRALPKKNYWSSLFLPEPEDDPHMLVEFLATKDKSLQVRMTMANATDEDRQWQVVIYAAPIEVETLPRLKIGTVADKLAKFELKGQPWRLDARGVKFDSVQETDSSPWLDFPTNVDLCKDSDNPTSPAKKRLCLGLAPVTIKAGQTKRCGITISPSRCASKAKVTWPRLAPLAPTELPYAHVWWETLRNQQYVRSYNCDAMTTRVLPGRQWGRFFIWDAGMTLLGALEEDSDFVEQMLDEMPDPAHAGKRVFSNTGSFIPTAILSWWETYALTAKPSLLKRYYDRMKRLMLAFYGWPELKPSCNSSGLIGTDENCGMDDHPARVYCTSRFVYAWDYKRTLPRCDDGKCHFADQPGMTSLGIRFAKIIRLAAYVLGKTDDMAWLSVLIEHSEEALNDLLWDEETGLYRWRTEAHGQLPMYGIDSCYPLLSNSASPERARRLIKHATDPAGMWTKYGITMVPQNSDYFRMEGYWNGAIWIPPQWFMWKAFYNNGQVARAKALAERVMKLWEANHAETKCCWEKFCLANGMGAGNSRFSGLSTPVLAFARSLRKPARVQFGHDVLVASKVKRNLSALQATLQAPFGETKTGFSAVLKTNTVYTLEIDGCQKKIHTDDSGYLAFNVTIPENETVSLILDSRL